MTSVSPISLPPQSPQPTTTAAAAAAAETASTTGAVRMEFGACSPLVKAGVVLNVAAFVALGLAMLAPYWLLNEQFKLTLGILYGCQNGHCISSDPLFTLIGIIVCATNKDDAPPGLTFDLGWAFAIGVVAGILYISTGACFLLDACL